MTPRHRTGHSSVAIARAYPKVLVDGIDLDEASIADAKQVGPADALRQARHALAPGGSVIVADERVADTFSAPADDMSG